MANLIIVESPIKARIILDDPKKVVPLRQFLTYTNKSIDFQLRKLQTARWFDAETMAEKVEELQAQRRPCLFEEDEFFLSGLREDVATFTQASIENKVRYPKPKIIPWSVVPPLPRLYQENIINKLLEAKHASVEVGTGLGKSLCALYIAKLLGLKTVVMCPSKSIADQLYADFVKYLGKVRVGRFYEGKKEHDKLITICIHASLARIEPGTPAFDAFHEAQVFISDESHLTPAKTLAKVCTELCGTAPYRFFFSGTQLRGDGADLLLRGIVGPQVVTMPVSQGIDEGWLAKLHFRIISMVSNDSYVSDDATSMTQRHLLYNPQVIEKVAAIANAAVHHNQGPVLILIEEVEQYHRLRPFFRYYSELAHGPLRKPLKRGQKDNTKFFVKGYKNPDNTALVKRFNEGGIPILVGTSAISTGTDIRPVKTCLMVKGGMSPVQVPQDVGRCTRLANGKTSCTIIDFDISNIDMLHRHTMARASLYNDIYPDHLEWL